MKKSRQRLVIDVLGYLSLVLFFILYRILEQSQSDFLAVTVPVIAFLPIAAVWHYYYQKFSED